MVGSTADQSSEKGARSLIHKKSSTKVYEINPPLDENLTIKTAKYSRAMMLFRQATLRDDEKRVSIELKHSKAKIGMFTQKPISEKDDVESLNYKISR